MKNVLSLVITLWALSIFVSYANASEWRWTVFRTPEGQDISGVAQISEIQATEHQLPGEERMFSINIKNLSDVPVDLGSALLFGVDGVTGRRFKLRTDNARDGLVLKRGEFAVLRGFFPVNGESVRELCVELKNKKVVRCYRSSHSLKSIMFPARYK